ncbi:hypothetical protein [Arcicella rigui]|uniref:Lipocalin-like domain-containing protein n=1 Tax=Arcicella rigui TaxID=797020 RepID=A0ABU5Q455_9BACT|nr:hypothetical protein [Arcicella rigui]MEA5137609.1 hypothetical protein [Arcicella rigui]
MKILSLSVAILMLISSCKSVDEVTPNKENSSKVSASELVGKWSPTYIQKSKAEGATWTTINTLVALPVIEFTADGNFLSDGKPGADCCGWVGNKYSYQDNKITFSDFKPCPDVMCIALACDGWKVHQLQSDTLVIEDCLSYSKFVRTK